MLRLIPFSSVHKKLHFQNNNQYICDNRGRVICLDGWSDPGKLCKVPICQFWDELSGEYLGCDHGSCTDPNRCSCEIGWEGVRCDQCLPLPGCLEGTCQRQPFECICHNSTQWTGPHCDIRKLKDL